ncbi:MAG: carbohydrate kinase family protein [Candidatus Hodarchaeota archaeon]
MNVARYSRKNDFIVIGAAGVDTNIYLLGRDINFEVEANFTENIDYVGQAGGYTTLGFAQLGHKTGYIGYVGADFNGQFIRDVFSTHNIDVLYFIDPAGTKRSVNFMYKDGRRKNFYDGKSHMTLKPDITKCKEMLQRSSFVHFNLMNWSRYLLPTAKELGLPISCDLQDIVNIQDPYRQDFIKAANILFFSNVNFRNPTLIIQTLQKTNPDAIIIVGMGSDGCALGFQNKIQFFKPIELLNRPIIDTNGAGDGLVVGILSSYLKEKLTLKEAILRGQIVARYTCSIKGNLTSLITKKQLDDYFQELKDHIAPYKEGKLS